jgi:hypothetical protein
MTDPILLDHRSQWADKDYGGTLMVTRATFGLSLISLLVLAGCTSAARQPVAARPAPSSTAQEQPEYPVIVRIVGRAQTVTVSAGPECALYSVKSAEGKLLVSQATLDELRARHPEVFHWIQPMVANETAIVADMRAD